MPEVEDLNHVRVFADPIVDQDRRMHQLANPGLPGDWTSQVGKAPQQSNMVEQGVAEAFGSRGEFCPRVFDKSPVGRLTPRLRCKFGNPLGDQAAQAAARYFTIV